MLPAGLRTQGRLQQDLDTGGRELEQGLQRGWRTRSRIWKTKCWSQGRLFPHTGECVYVVPVSELSIFKTVDSSFEVYAWVIRKDSYYGMFSFVQQEYVWVIEVLEVIRCSLSAVIPWHFPNRSWFFLIFWCCILTSLCAGYTRKATGWADDGIRGWNFREGLPSDLPHIPQVPHSHSGETEERMGGRDSEE